MRFSAFILTVLPSVALAVPLDNPFTSVRNLHSDRSSGIQVENLAARAAANQTSGPQVDLGYDVYEGVYNSSTDLNSWIGIRYASPPIGALRWQAPQIPAINRSSVIQAAAFPNQCPQQIPNGGSQEAAIEYVNTNAGSEDCLYLSVFATPNAKNLPVLVYIHGGGYGSGNGQGNFSDLVNTNNNGLVLVSIQYRLGAFGFLSSDEVNKFGALNAGIKDQIFALQWIQTYIELFGGNASHVTIAGESAGGGSTMLLSLAYGGNLGTSLFTNVISASPYLPMQYDYNAWEPSQAYYGFAQKAGCFNGDSAGNTGPSIFSCLVGKDSATLQNASAAISSSGRWENWAFLPVTDYSLIQNRPSQQLQRKKVNGLRILSANTANEGTAFAPQNITTEADLTTFVGHLFLDFSPEDVAKTLLYYPGLNTTDSPSTPKFATTGISGPTFINQSVVAIGNQQRAEAIYAETTFVCPSYWLADAYTSPGHTAYKYQYSVLPAVHGQDTLAYVGPRAVFQSESFATAMKAIWGGFAINDNPSISTAIAVGDNGTDAGDGRITDWPAWDTANPLQINLNQTGGVLVDMPVAFFASINATVAIEPGLRNKFDVVDAWTFEGGRGTRCDFWRSMSQIVPE